MAQIKGVFLLPLILVAVIDLQSSQSQAAVINQDPSLIGNDVQPSINEAAGMVALTDDDHQAAFMIQEDRKQAPKGTCVNHWYNWESLRESDCRDACHEGGCYSGFCQGDACRCFTKDLVRC